MRYNRILFLGVEKISSKYLCNLIFFSRTFNENFNFLKNCPYDFHKILHSNSILHPNMMLCAQWHRNRVTGI